MSKSSTLAAGALLIALGCDPGVEVSPRPRGAEGGSGPSIDEKRGTAGSGGVALPERVCDDGDDDDGDGAVDCADPDCIPDRVLADDVGDTASAWVPTTGERAVLLYTGSGTVGARRRIRALSIDGTTATGASQLVYEGRSVWFDGMPAPGGGTAVVLARKDTGRVELVMLDDAGAVSSSAVLVDGDGARPLVSMAVDPGSGAIALLRSVDRLQMEFAWFDRDGSELRTWRTLSVLEFHTARLLVSGGKVWLMVLPNFGDDGISGPFWFEDPVKGYGGRRFTPELRSHPVPLVPREGEVLFHTQGVEALAGGGIAEGPELLRMALNGTELDRRGVPQPGGTLRLATYVGAWEGGMAAVYPGVVDGAEHLLVVRASADLAELEGPSPLMAGLPTIVYLASTPEEDRIFYVSEDGKKLRVRVIPRHCR